MSYALYAILTVGIVIGIALKLRSKSRERSRRKERVEIALKLGQEVRDLRQGLDEGAPLRDRSPVSVPAYDENSGRFFDLFQTDKTVTREVASFYGHLEAFENACAQIQTLHLHADRTGTPGPDFEVGVSRASGRAESHREEALQVAARLLPSLDEYAGRSGSGGEMEAAAGGT